jgi:hypothetical protein
MSDHAFPPPPETVFCPKCLRNVVIAATPSRQMESECALADCPIRNHPENQVGPLWGTLISFEAPSEISQEDRIARFAEWERRGVRAIEADLRERGGSRYVGGPAAVVDLAREWVRSKENRPETRMQQPTELVALRPGIWGISIDLKELGRRVRRWWQ